MVQCKDMTLPSGNIKVSSPTASKSTWTLWHETGMKIISVEHRLVMSKATYSWCIAVFNFTGAVRQNGEEFWDAKSLLKEESKNW